MVACAEVARGVEWRQTGEPVATPTFVRFFYIYVAPSCVIPVTARHTATRRVVALQHSAEPAPKAVCSPTVHRVVSACQPLSKTHARACSAVVSRLATVAVVGRETAGSLPVALKQGTRTR